MTQHAWRIALCALTLGACSSVDHRENHRFAAPDKVLLVSSGANLLSATPRPIAVDEVGQSAVIVAMQLAPGRHTVFVNYWEAQYTMKRCEVTYDFLPGKKYRVIKSSLDDNREIKHIWGKEARVWLTEIHSPAVLGECK